MVVRNVRCAGTALPPICTQSVIYGHMQRISRQPQLVQMLQATSGERRGSVVRREAEHPLHPDVLRVFSDLRGLHPSLQV